MGDSEQKSATGSAVLTSAGRQRVKRQQPSSITAVALLWLVVELLVTILGFLILVGHVVVWLMWDKS